MSGGMAFFDGFTLDQIDTGEAMIRVRHGGDGPPVVLLHGHPRTHTTWHRVAPLLAERHTVVCPDLRGYGGSSAPPTTPDHEPYSKRAMARDVVALMRALGHERFAVAGHDRGGRVAYRMALDDPGAVTRLAVLDIVPTGEIWRGADALFALGYWHWGFLAQPAPLPERLILGDPGVFWIAIERMGIKSGDDRYPAEVVEAYRAQLADPAAVEAMCEDYRAGATIDRAFDDADRGRRTIGCPVRALWGGAGALPLFYDDPLELWRPYAPRVTGRAVEGASHFLVEDAPGEVAADLGGFFGEP